MNCCQLRSDCLLLMHSLRQERIWYSLSNSNITLNEHFHDLVLILADNKVQTLLGNPKRYFIPLAEVEHRLNHLEPVAEHCWCEGLAHTCLDEVSLLLFDSLPSGVFLQNVVEALLWQQVWCQINSHFTENVRTIICYSHCSNRMNILELNNR